MCPSCLDPRVWGLGLGGVGLYIGVILGLYCDNGKSNGSYYKGVIQGVGFRALSPRPFALRMHFLGRH